jgi:hypothetical protein
MAKSARLQKILEMRQKNVDKLPKAGAELEAMGREMVKDIRGTIHQAVFGQPEHPSEPGTPLNPTPQLVTEGLTGKDIYGRGKEANKDAQKTREGPELDM